MKLLKISIIRAIAAIVVGVLLLKYDSAVLKGLTISLGIMFLIAGVVSLVGWLNSRRKSADFRAYGDDDKDGNGEGQPMFPIVGLGSLLLGCILSLTKTDDYLDWAMYLIGAVLVLGGLNTVLNLFSAKKMEPLPAWMWLPPFAVIIASVFAMIRGLVPAQTCTTILGVTALVYALMEIVYSVLLYNVRKRYEKTQAQVRRAEEMKGAKADDAQLIPELKAQEAE
jgi:uncharacterized membrane protein HdeD (DUF308 family)